MKYIKLIFLVGLLMNNSIYAQTFEKTIRTEFDEIVYDATFYDNNHVIFPYNYGENETNYHVKVYKMNIYNGELTDSVDMDFNNYEQYNLASIYQILPLHDTLYICLGKAINKFTNDNQLYICHINKDLEQTFDTIVGDPEKQDLILDYFINSENNIITAGSEVTEGKGFNFSNTNIFYDQTFKDNTSIYNLLLSERTIWGTEIKRNLIEGVYGLGLSIIEVPNQSVYHFHLRGDGHKYLTIDSNTLEIIKENTYPLGFTPRMAFTGKSDSILYIAGRHNDLSTNAKENLSFLELDTMGNLISHHIYEHDSDIFYSYKTFDAGEDHIYFGTNIPFDYTPLTLYPEPRWILLYKLELNGDIKWQKFYKGEVNYMPYRIMSTPDNGALIFSTKYDWNDIYPMQSDLHILKVNSEGNYVPVGTDKIHKNTSQIIAWPNPTSNQINFNFGLMENLKIDLIDLNGKIIFSGNFHHSPTLNLSEFSSGIYLYRISNKSGFIEYGKFILK